jgi:hypothetical protein
VILRGAEGQDKWTNPTIIIKIPTLGQELQRLSQTSLYGRVLLQSIDIESKPFYSLKRDRDMREDADGNLFYRLAW